MRGHKHLIKCRCVLPQYKKLENPPPHKFIVFSVIKDNDDVITKYVQCNNCGIIHKIVNICTSEILSGKDFMRSLTKIEDIKSFLHVNIINMLESNSADLPTWEAVQFIIENKLWGDIVVLSSDIDGEEMHGKYVKIISESLCKVEQFSRSTGII